MSDCQHRWEMTNIQFGFIAFEKCSHCDRIRTFFSIDDAPVSGDDYREGDCLWRRVENAQSFRFDLKCSKCHHVEKFHDLMGLLYCTGCMSDCPVDILQKKLETEKTWVLVAFGFLPKTKGKLISNEKLDLLTDYFNQRRDTSRSRIKIISYDLIDNFSLCKGEFIYDRGMLSLEPVEERKPLL